ncbi:YacL family protein [Sodalis sp. RH24]|uniref:YacL family protein n=1 Tax=unclassified Sodalis (in: enterobacteria) TaxID=2636512 RepID=UPI0039659970
MDYAFQRDITGQVRVTFSMGHEAVGHWLNEEVKGNLVLLDEVEGHIKRLAGGQDSWQCVGHEYTFWTDGDEVIIRANELAFVNDELEEGMNYYDEESLSLCGTDDFLQVLRHYRDFSLSR